MAQPTKYSSLNHGLVSIFLARGDMLDAKLYNTIAKPVFASAERRRSKSETPLASHAWLRATISSTTSLGIRDELCPTAGWHRKHAVRALRRHETVTPGEVGALRERRRKYGVTTKAG